MSKIITVRMWIIYALIIIIILFSIIGIVINIFLIIIL